VRAAAFRLFILAAALASTGTGATGPALAEAACPVSDDEAAKAGGYAAAVEKAVAEAPDCLTAYRRLQLCQLGSSADNALGAAARGKCEALFLPKARPPVKKAYGAALKRCDRIAEGNTGSMYQSFAALCQARAARDFARKAGAKLAK
jgi:hypothetical protein